MTDGLGKTFVDDVCSNWRNRQLSKEETLPDAFRYFIGAGTSWSDVCFIDARKVKKSGSTREPPSMRLTDIVGQQVAVWTRIAKDRENRRALADGCFLHLKDTA